MSDTQNGVWVVSDVDTEGHYFPAVQPSEDVSIPLDGDRAIQYALAFLTAVGRAQYDAGVLYQLRQLIGVDAAASAVGALRDDRAALDDVATAPLRLQPAVSSAGEPVLQVYLNGKPLTQWSPEQAAQHALHVLQVLVGVSLDAAYLRFLTARVGLPEDVARAVVYDVGQHQ
jgi:hypothetical protein